MKNPLVVLRGMTLFTFVVFLLASCTSDPYDSGDSSLSNMHVDFADVYTDGNRLVCAGMTDDGDTLVFDKPYECRWATTPDSIYRTLLYNNRLEGNGAQVLTMGQVYVLRPHALGEDEKMHTDPVTFESVWMSRNGRYINLGLYVKTGQTVDVETKQTVGMVLDNIVEADDGARTVNLTLYHDQGDVPEYYSTRLYASIPTSVFRHGDIINLSVNSYNGKIVKEFKLP